MPPTLDLMSKIKWKQGFGEIRGLGDFVLENVERLNLLSPNDWELVETFTGIESKHSGPFELAHVNRYFDGAWVILKDQTTKEIKLIGGDAKHLTKIGDGLRKLEDTLHTYLWSFLAKHPADQFELVPKLPETMHFRH